MHPGPTRSRIPSQGHGMGGEAERRLHFRHGPPPPQGKGDAVSRVWALSRQVLPTGRRLAGGSRGLGPWPGPPPSPGARHFWRRCPCAGPSSNPPVVSPQSAVPHVCGGDCSSAGGLQQHYLWTAAALLLDSDTASPKRQHCLQLAAALPSHGSGRAFIMRQQHCCWTVTLPPQRDSTACSWWQHCLHMAAAVPS